MHNILTSGNTWVRYLMILVSVVLLIYFIPKQAKFKYEFEKGKNWQHEDLYAPFSFAIEKIDEEIEEDREEIKQSFRPYYNKYPKTPENQIAEFEEALKNSYPSEDSSIARQEFYLSKGKEILKEQYQDGVIALADSHKTKGPNFPITIVTNKVAQDHFIKDFARYEKAKEDIKTITRSDSLLNVDFFRKALINSLEPNISYNRALSSRKLNALLSQISLTKGLIEEGELVISTGTFIDDEKYQVLTSLRKEYEESVSGSNRQYLIWVGYSLLVLFIMGIFAFYLNVFKQDVFRSNKSVILILLNILIFVFFGSYISTNHLIDVYVIPYAIVPIILLAFFGPRVAIMTHLVIIMISGIFLPNGFQFVFLQILAGFMTILGMSRIRYLSQFFVASLLIVFAYYVGYLSLKFIQVGSFQEIEYTNLLWFTGNFVLTLLAYPLIYAFEKLFGFVSDITLMELSDINKKLLRKLAMKAPGTFQHSLQVANLSESVLSEIGGNALLARVGALYHDIGKMENPQYFIENQKYLDNPHDDLDEKKSAEIIIGHVTNGITMGKQNNLPEEILKFIRTHHGTSRVEYFYQNYLRKNKTTDVDETEFRYPGPKPFSKETAVLMLVDSVEAASRSIKEPDEEKLDKLIDNIIEHKLSDNQLENADITMREINIIRNRLKKLLKSIYHVRVEYPGDEKA